MESTPQFSVAADIQFCVPQYAYVFYSIICFFISLLYILHPWMCINLDVQEEVCFGEELMELTTLKEVVVNLTRNGPACDAIEFSMNIFYNKSGGVSVGKHIQS